jgi:hypothetical protein
LFPSGSLGAWDHSGSAIEFNSINEPLVQRRTFALSAPDFFSFSV